MENRLHYTQYIEYSQQIEYDNVFNEVINLISYKPLFETMHKKNITEYQLIFNQGLSANTIHRIKKGLPITTKTLDTLCFILDCEVQDIIAHDKSE